MYRESQRSWYGGKEFLKKYRFSHTTTLVFERKDTESRLCGYHDPAAPFVDFVEFSFSFKRFKIDDSSLKRIKIVNNINNVTTILILFSG